MAERSAHHFNGISCLGSIGSNNNNTNNNNNIQHGTPSSQISSSTMEKSVRNPSIISSSPPNSPPPPQLPPASSLQTSSTASTASFPSPHIPMLLHHPNVSSIKGADLTLSSASNPSSSSLPGSFLFNAAVQHLPALHLWPTMHLSEASKNLNTVRLPACYD